MRSEQRTRASVFFRSKLDEVGGWFSSYFMIGDLAEVVVYSSALSASETDLTNAYLVDRYGMP